MAAGLNKVILIGNLGKDPEIQVFESTKKASFSLATTESYKNREGVKVDQTEWHNVVLWRGLAEIAEKYLRKGNTIYLEGKIKSRSWEDANGVKKYITEILGDNMIMLGGNRTGSDVSGDIPAPQYQSAPTPQVQNPATSFEAVPDDDLPF